MIIFIVTKKNIDASNAGGVESASSAVKRPHGSNGQPPSNNPHHKQQQYPHQQPPVKRPHNGIIKMMLKINFKFFFRFRTKLIYYYIQCYFKKFSLSFHLKSTVIFKTTNCIFRL